MNNIEEEEGTHIQFVTGPPKPKTKVWYVVSRYDPTHFLGWIGWFAYWRKYGFFPKPNTVYEQLCLREIASFCERQSRAHQESLKEAGNAKKS